MFSRTFLALASFLAVAAANPVGLDTRDADAGVSVTICIDPGFGHCITIPAVSGSCVNLVGGLSGWNKEISSARIPLGFVCTFYKAFSCFSSGNSFNGDSVTLPGGNYPSFANLPGDGGPASFYDTASSFTCTPIV